jgi:hypothetical protein
MGWGSSPKPQPQYGFFWSQSSQNCAAAREFCRCTAANAVTKNSPRADPKPRCAQLAVGGGGEDGRRRPGAILPGALQKHPADHRGDEHHHTRRTGREVLDRRAGAQPNQPPPDAKQDRPRDQRAIDRPCARPQAFRADKGRPRRRAIANPGQVTARAAAITTARLGSHAPNRSRNASTLVGCIICEISRPKPNTRPHRSPIATAGMTRLPRCGG